MVITSPSEGMNGGVTVWIVVMAFASSAVSNIVVSSGEFGSVKR
jgi:hypothetical protein